MIWEFTRYYAGQGSRQELLDAIVDYDFTDYESMLQAVSATKHAFPCTRAPLVVHSNGSSGDSLSRYDFSPDFEFWCPCIEKVLRGFDIQIRLTHGNRDTEASCYLRPVVVRRGDEYSIFLDLASTENVGQLLDVLSRISNEHGCKVSLCGKPNTWLLAGTDSRVREGLLRCSPYVKSLVNEDWEPWIHPSLASIFFNDQMIDWKTGVNFYTCSKGTRHFLPIFHVDHGRATNLLNTALGGVSMSDEWAITGSRTLCSCGRYYLPFRFQSHVKNHLDISRNIIHYLKSGYTNLQFLKKEGRIEVPYSCSTNKFLDEEIIRDNVGDCTFYADRQFYIGRKKYNFWKDDREVKIIPFSRSKVETVKLL